MAYIETAINLITVDRPSTPTPAERNGSTANQHKAFHNGGEKSSYIHNETRLAAWR